jgi:hypothetical protein
MTQEMEMEDGGIYILITPGVGGDEYRIVHAYGARGITGKDSKEVNDDAIDKGMVRKMFGMARVFVDKLEADKYADKMYYRYEMSDPFLVKAGIVKLTLAQPFGFYVGRKNAVKKETVKKEAPKKVTKKSVKKRKGNSDSCV